MIELTLMEFGGFALGFLSIGFLATIWLSEAIENHYNKEEDND